MAEKKAVEPAEQLVDSFREISQIMTESLVAFQERNIKFAQSTLSNAMEVMQSHIEATDALVRELEQLAKKEQDAFQHLVPGQMEGQWMEPYLGFLRTPFSSYREALKAVEKTTREGFKTVEQTIEDVGKATQQPVPTGSKQARK